MSDKYEDERFDGSCPTCGQKFLGEKIEKLKFEVERLEKECIEWAKIMANSTRVITNNVPKR